MTTWRNVDSSEGCKVIVGWSLSHSCWFPLFIHSRIPHRERFKCYATDSFAGISGCLQEEEIKNVKRIVLFLVRLVLRLVPKQEIKDLGC